MKEYIMYIKVKLILGEGKIGWFMEKVDLWKSLFIFWREQVDIWSEVGILYRSWYLILSYIILSCIVDSDWLKLETFDKNQYIQWLSLSLIASLVFINYFVSLTEPFTQYRVQVRAITGGGKGEFSDVYPVYTDVAGK